MEVYIRANIRSENTREFVFLQMSFSDSAVQCDEVQSMALVIDFNVLSTVDRVIIIICIRAFRLLLHSEAFDLTTTRPRYNIIYRLVESMLI